MAVNSHHPLYDVMVDQWVKMRDCYAGPKAVKDKGVTYLPATTGMEIDGMAVNADGWKAYQKYRDRAVFPSFVADAVSISHGTMWRKMPTIELPKGLEYMRSKATLQGETLEDLLSRINEMQMVTGRIGLLLDVLPSGEFYVSTYQAEDCINWDDGTTDEALGDVLNLVVLNESAYQRSTSDLFEWELIERYRVLLLGGGGEGTVAGAYSNGLYTQGEKGGEFLPGNMMNPVYRGTPLMKIPFVFINPKDILAAPDNAPFLPVADDSLTVYRGEADYRQSLHQQGQDTLVVIGGDDSDKRVGAGAKLNVPQGGDAKFIGVSSSGLPEQRQALENDRKAVAYKTGQLISNMNSTAESGNALQIRVASQTATLNRIALAGARGLEALLQIAAEWMGLNPDDVKIIPNQDFADDKMTGKELGDLMTAKMLGAPISDKTIHTQMRQRDLTDMTYEDELAEIQDEEPRNGGKGTGITDPNQPNPVPNQPGNMDPNQPNPNPDPNQPNNSGQ